jgi:hypothetical protein
MDIFRVRCKATSVPGLQPPFAVGDEEAVYWQGRLTLFAQRLASTRAESEMQSMH